MLIVFIFILIFLQALVISNAFSPHRSTDFRIGHLYSTTSDNTVVSRCTQKIKALLETDRCIVRSSSDDPNGAHITIECISEKFRGLRSMQRQQLLYKAIWDEMADGGMVHAVDSVIAKTPEEVGL